MTDGQIEQIALANGFKLKQQLDGSIALNPYVFEFARALLAPSQERYRDCLWHLTDAQAENCKLKDENSALKAENEKLFSCLNRVMKARNIKARMEARAEAEAIIASKGKGK